MIREIKLELMRDCEMYAVQRWLEEQQLQTVAVIETDDQWEVLIRPAFERLFDPQFVEALNSFCRELWLLEEYAN